MSGSVFRDAGGLVQAARWALYADSLVCAAAIVLSLTQGSWFLLFGDFAGPFAAVQLLTALGSLILFLIWFYRANDNVRAMGADGLTGSPALSVAWFFIPIAFLFMPFIAVRDTWKASAAPRDWQAQPTDPLLGFWWACFLVTHIAGTISFRLWLMDDFELLDAIGVVDLIANGAAIAANLLAVAVMRRIQHLQANPGHLSERFS
ncbi:MAG TPA: DUF4328 domain-containing protein [Allosphingosinicella sp.]|nr:DUF4328 domain-containing protein [Allosphingosinicella sp.]